MKASGINPPEEPELDQDLREWMEKIREADLKFQTEKSKQDYQKSEELKAGEDLRLLFLDIFSQTRKKSKDPNANDDKKRRPSSDDLVSLL